MTSHLPGRNRGRSLRARVPGTFVLMFLLWAGAAFGQTSSSVNGVYRWGEEDLLPFPNDFYTRADADSPTGLKVEMPAQAFTERMLQNAPFDAAAALRGLNAQDGFSPVVPALFTVPAELEPDVLPALEGSLAPGSKVVFFRLDTLERLPFSTVQVVQKDKGKVVTLVAVIPYDRLLHGVTYAVAIRKGLIDRGGVPIPSPVGLSDALAGRVPVASGERATEQLRALGVSLQALELPPDEVALAFAFTVESEESWKAPMQARMKAVKAHEGEAGLTATSLRIRHRPLKREGKATHAGRGHFDVLRVTDRQGRESGEPTTLSLDFMMRLPSSCPESGCPVVIFGHGLGATDKSMFHLADELAARQMVVVATHAPWHGNQLRPLGMLLRSRKNSELMHAVMVEHILRNVQLAHLVISDLSERDLRTRRQQRRHPERPLRVRADRIFYVGQSLGGICGVTTVSLTPEISAALFDVAGGPALEMVFESRAAQALDLDRIRFGRLSVTESRALIPLAAALFDDVDPVGAAPFLTHHGSTGLEPRYFSQQAGVGDGLVPNALTAKLARTLGLKDAWPLEQAPTKPVSSVEGPALRYFHLTDNWFFAHLELWKTGAIAADFLVYSLKQLEAQASPSSSPGAPPAQP